MLLQQNYGFWEPWLNPQKVTFDGDNKIIYINYGETNIDVKVDIYSAWKEWVKDPEHFNSKYLPALRSVGGDPTVNGQYLGATFFLTEGWRIKTWDGDHRLSVVGNLYTDEGEPAFLVTPGYNIIIESQVSSIVTIAGTYPNTATSSEIATAVWESPQAPGVPTVPEISTGVWTSTDALTEDGVATAVWASPDAPIIPTLEQVAYAVWEEAMLGHATPDSFGKRLKEILPTLWGIK